MVHRRRSRQARRKASSGLDIAVIASFDVLAHRINHCDFNGLRERCTVLTIGWPDEANARRDAVRRVTLYLLAEVDVADDALERDKPHSVVDVADGHGF
jgi:hypothetical protein